MRIVKRIYGGLLRIDTGLFGKDHAKKADARIRFHKKLNLKNPENLADKICWLSLHGDQKQMAFCTDKWTARDYVRQKGLEDTLVPVYGSVYRNSDDVPWDDLPEQFVLKATHGCKMNLICADRKHFNFKLAADTVEKWLMSSYGYYSMELHYELIPKGVYIEKYLADADTLVDYKFFCYNGKPSWILACGARHISDDGKSMVDLYQFDLDWKPIHCVKGWQKHTAGTKWIERPDKLDEMISIAEKLSEDFDFVRVDLYCLKGNVYFGELTFTPAAGILPAYDENFLLEEGRKLIIRNQLI